MRRLEDIGAEEIRDLLGKGWLTHDGAWFYNAASELGIETANRINKAAIKTMAPLEMKRARRLLDAGESFQSPDERNEFALSALNLTLPGSIMGRLRVTFPAPDVFRWEWDLDECFAYKGMRMFGLIDGYECGVLYRIECWLEALGLDVEMEPEITSCIMHTEGRCSGEFRFL